MKRYIKSTISKEIYDERFEELYTTDNINAMKNALRQIFRNNPQTILSIVLPPFQYIVGRYPGTGRIEIWDRYVSDSPDPQDRNIVNPGFERGMRLDRGYDDVARYVLRLEPDLSKWTQS